MNANSDNPEHPPGKEIIYNGSVQDGDDPIVVVQAPDETAQSSNEGHILVVWKLSAFLIRPRLRLQNPSVVFAATAHLKPAEQVQHDTLREEYLPSQVPSGINLLEVSDSTCDHSYLWRPSVPQRCPWSLVMSNTVFQ